MPSRFSPASTPDSSHRPSSPPPSRTFLGRNLLPNQGESHFRDATPCFPRAGVTGTLVFCFPPSVCSNPFPRTNGFRELRPRKTMDFANAKKHMKTRENPLVAPYPPHKIPTKPLRDARSLPVNACRFFFADPAGEKPQRQVR